MFEGVSSAAVAKEDRSDWTVDAILHARIVDGDRDGLDADLDRALAEGNAALDIVNDMLLPGMKVVGDLFGSGQMQLPFVLQSAETMKAAVAQLEPHMEKADQGGKGASCSPPSRATCTTSARTSSTSSSPTTATRSSTSASR
jgi:5-methyltetrahydrofolate--homocysteine methyltransferase